MMGSHYLVEHCISQYNMDSENEGYQIYTSEMLRAIANSISEIFGGGMMFEKSWKELLDYKPETRSAEEIKTSIIDKVNALGGGEENGRI